MGGTLIKLVIWYSHTSRRLLLGGQVITILHNDKLYFIVQLTEHNYMANWSLFGVSGPVASHFVACNRQNGAGCSHLLTKQNLWAIYIKLLT